VSRRSRLAAAFALGAQSLFCAGAQAGGSRQVKLGEPLELRVGEKVSIGEGEVLLRFVGVTQDSRCPKGEQCIVAGKAVASFEAAPRTGEAVTFELETGGSASESSETDVSGFRISLRGLDPYPVTGRSISPQDYVARLSVGRFASAPPPDK
jgi:hypothetical protein